MLAVIISPRISDNNDDISSAVIEGDKMTYLQVNDPRFEPLNQIMLLFSQYGREVAWTLTGVLLFVFGGWTGRKTAILMAITMLILIPIGTIAKETLGRLRPAMPEAELLMAPDSGYSFPSGHAVIASSGAALMLTLYGGSYKKLAVSIGLAVEAALVCFSRVYVGDQDLLAPAANSVMMAQRIPNSWLVIIQGTGHGMMLQVPNELSAIIQTFLETANK